ncbi:MAG: hypothetical protein JNK78_04440 [Planctomycetes bacterium]|nr:hypothetical protein [Planctomycetota bacterium]
MRIVRPRALYVRLVGLLLAVLAVPARAAAAHVPLAQGVPAASRLPVDGVHTKKYRDALFALRDDLKRTAPPPITAKEQADCADWMAKANPAIEQVLVGHHVIVMATKGFAERAARSDFLLRVDLGFEVLVHLFGTDPTARVGRRFFVWPDPDMGGGHRCIGSDLRIHVGRNDQDNAEWFERFFHEMTHGFQFAHPAGHVMLGGFFEGWAEFMQAAVTDHLSPLGPPFEGRADWYAGHFPAAAQFEYLQTRLPIEEIIAYDPSAGLLMELVNATKMGDAGHRDWAPIRALLQEPFVHPRWTPWHLWPAMMASDCMAAFGAARARPILAHYRFPVDAASLEQARRQNWGSAKPDPSPREGAAGADGWFCAGPIANPERHGLERDPLDAEDMAWRWLEVAADAKVPPTVPPVDGAPRVEWRTVAADAHHGIALDGAAGGPAFFYLATTLPPGLRTRLTLYVSSDDECAVWLDGKLVHLVRGTRACTPDFPDVNYADATGTKGQVVVLVVNHGGEAAFSLAVAKGGLLFRGFEERFGGDDQADRAAAVSYLASRRFRQPLESLLAMAGKSNDARIRNASAWWPDERPAGGVYVEAEDAYARGSIVGGYYWNNAGASGNQCVARNWGGAATNWLSLPLTAHTDGVRRVRLRYACGNRATLRVRLRRGDRIAFVSDVQDLEPSGKDWNTWVWHDVVVPATLHLTRGVYHVELIEPSGGVDVDVVGLVAR